MYSIAIDGPAGAGKSTIAKNIAKKLGFIYIDTGAMYRAMALYIMRNNIASDDEEGILAVLDQVHIEIQHVNGEQHVYLNEEDVTTVIRTNEVSQMASVTSVYPKVRIKLVEIQRKLAEKTNVIMDGREIGTYVLPNASLKIFLTASVAERARRRFEENQAKGIASDLEQIKREIEERDHRDMNRAFAPLKKAEDAIEVDSSHMTIEEVEDAIIKEFEKIKK